jgi:hypothetical protein
MARINKYEMIFVQPDCDAIHVTLPLCGPHINGFFPVGSLEVHGVGWLAAKYWFASGQYPSRVRSHYSSSDIAKCALLTYRTGFTRVTRRTSVWTFTVVDVLSFVMFHVCKYVCVFVDFQALKTLQRCFCVSILKCCGFIHYAYFMMCLCLLQYHKSLT